MEQEVRSQASKARVRGRFFWLFLLPSSHVEQKLQIVRRTDVPTRGCCEINSNLKKLLKSKFKLELSIGFSKSATIALITVFELNSLYLHGPWCFKFFCVLQQYPHLGNGTAKMKYSQCFLCKTSAIFTLLCSFSNYGINYFENEPIMIECQDTFFSLLLQCSAATLPFLSCAVLHSRKSN